jgi:putative acetyltransferase
MRIRPYVEDDGPATLDVFLRAVRGTASRDYTEEQVAAWAPDDMDLERWARRRASASTLVAVDGERVVGFADLVDDGHVDMTFVDPGFGRRGVATALLEAVVVTARSRRLDRLTVFASITARPFFERQGFVLDEQVQVELDGVMLTTNAMSRELA